MKVEITNWVKKACKKYKIHAYYLPRKNLYVIHLWGKAIQNFSEDNFYQIPPAERMKMIEPLIKVGLNNNLASKSRDMLTANYYGHAIVRP